MIIDGKQYIPLKKGTYITPEICAEAFLAKMVWDNCTTTTYTLSHRRYNKFTKINKQYSLEKLADSWSGTIYTGGHQKNRIRYDIVLPKRKLKSFKSQKALWEKYLNQNAKKIES